MGRTPWRYVLTNDPVAVHRRRSPFARTPTTVVVSALTRTVILFARVRWRWRVIGALPPTRVVLVSSHASYWDGLLACMLDQRVFAVAGHDWREIRGAGWYVNAYGVLWTNHDPLAAAHEVLTQDGVVWIAPAGWEARGRGHVRRGAAELARTGQAPIYLLGISGLRSRTLDITITELVAYDASLTLEHLRASLEAALHPSADIARDG